MCWPISCSTEFQQKDTEPYSTNLTQHHSVHQIMASEVLLMHQFHMAYKMFPTCLSEHGQSKERYLFFLLLFLTNFLCNENFTIVGMSRTLIVRRVYNHLTNSPNNIFHSKYINLKFLKTYILLQVLLIPTSYSKILPKSIFL